jgi:uncharacterized protein (TIRG00374 family)
VFQSLLSVVVVLVVFVGALPQITDFGDVWGQIRAMTPLEVETLLLAASWNLLTYLFVIVPASPGLTFPQAFVMTQSTTAASNTFPAGAAVGIGMTYAMYSSWGFSKADSALAILVSGIWNNFVKLGLPVLALALLALQGNTSPQRVTAGLVGIATLVAAVTLFALMLRSDDTAHRVGSWMGRAASLGRALVRKPPVERWGEAAVRFRARTVTLLRRSWWRLTIGAVVSHVSLYVVLLLALRHVGVAERTVSWVEVLAIFAFVRLLSTLPITPGGVGVVELGLTAGLVAAGGDRAKVVAAVLVYRALTYVLPVPLGVVTYIVWRRKSSWRKPPAESPRAAVTS